MEKSDLIRLKHMLDAAQSCLEFSAGKDIEDFKEDQMLAFSTIRALEILGEAAANVSLQFRKKHAQIPWKEIIGMRNRLIHAYFDIDYHIVWSAVSKELPTLTKELKEILDKE